MSTKVHVYKETLLREGGATRGPDNHIGQEYLPAGYYDAFVQCAGEEFREDRYYNYWWVYLDGGKWGYGWVTAVHISSKDDGNDDPIEGVPQQRTVFQVL